MNVKRLKSTGRLFFTTDIHGELPTLVHGLKELGFIEEEDLLVCAGDLIDRGRYNLATAYFFLDKANDPFDAYHSVLGNHDLFSFDNQGYNKDFACWLMYGGKWAFTKITEEDRKLLGHDMMSLPYAIEVEHQGLKYGVVHAGVPDELTWGEFILALENNNPAAKFECVWLRDYVEYKDYEEYQVPLKGIDFTIHGHTPVKEPLMVGNRLHIDTGLVYGKYLTITEAVDGKFIHHKFDLV
tara:strand:+ start:4624 stop:5343 length:720 start_codon:yes stop_codon:yes gene_type:complete